jgi:eukaryotic-like serine/threonine-protein kinase
MRDDRGSSGSQDGGYQTGERLRRGRYVIGGVHGVGGMSVVYRAERRVGWFQREVVALKMARRWPDGARGQPERRAQAEQRLAREAALLGMINHWRVPRAVEAFRERGQPHLVMQFVPGWTLERVLTDPDGGLRPPWPEANVVALGRALAELLVALHTGPMPILVRDLKPSNLIITREGHVALVDLGIACPLRRGELAPPAVRRLGTRGYAPPEQVAGREPEDERVDLYALGAVLHRVATGWNPARRDDGCELPPARVLNPALSPQLEGLLASLLRLDRRQRLPEARLAERALLRCGA